MRTSLRDYNKFWANLQSMSTTESTSRYENLEKKSIKELLLGINAEDHEVPKAVAKVIPDIEVVVEQITLRMKQGGRLFYIGAGTSGRLGVVDASECPPTFGVPSTLVTGIIAGGDGAIRKSVEKAEDSTTQAWMDLQHYGATSLDAVVGIAASGSTPYVVHGLKESRARGLYTAGICCNTNSAMSKVAENVVEVIVGPEFITGSTRMKAGTAQKLVLNMISTTVMIQLGRVKGNKMVDMQLSNDKLVDRAVRMVQEELSVSSDQAKILLEKYGNVRNVIENFNKNLL